MLAGCVLLVGLWALILPLPEAPRDGVKGDFLIRQVNVVDVESAVLRTNQDVVVRDGAIAGISPSGAVEPEGALIIVNGAGRFLMPGLWDMHTHSYKISPQFTHPLFIANGVTGVRDMSGCMSEPDPLLACIEDRKRWNQALERGDAIAPRYLLQSSYQINGGNEVPRAFPEFFRARSRDEIHRLVTFYRQQGADFLKIYSELSPDAYQMLAAEARNQGLSLAGHRPLRVSLQQMLAAGQRSIEHPRLFLFECHAGAAAFRANPDPLAAYDAAFRQRLVDNQDDVACAALIQSLADADIWWTPTLQVLRMSARAGDAAFRADARLPYVPYLIRNFMWMPDADRARANLEDNPGNNVYAAMYQMALRHVGQARAAGAGILAGTDAGDTYVFPGFGIHDELQELVRAGLSPGEALRSATLDAASFARMEDRFGSVAQGKTADLLLLDANPLDDVAHTRTIAGVFFNGRYFDRPALDHLLDFARDQAGSIRLNLRLLWNALSSPLMRVQLAD